MTPSPYRNSCPSGMSGDVGAAAYEPDSGYGDPHSAATGFVRRAQELGAEVSQGEEVLRIIKEGGRVTGVKTSKRTISTENVVLAGGAWSKGLGAGVGLDLPINCMMLSVGVLEEAAGAARESSRLHRCGKRHLFQARAWRVDPARIQQCRRQA